MQNNKSYEQKVLNKKHPYLAETDCVMWQLVGKGAYFNINCQGLIG